MALRRAGPPRCLDVFRWWAGARSELVPLYIENGDSPVGEVSCLDNSPVLGVNRELPFGEFAFVTGATADVQPDAA